MHHISADHSVPLTRRSQLPWKMATYGGNMGRKRFKTHPTQGTNKLRAHVQFHRGSNRSRTPNVFACMRERAGATTGARTGQTKGAGRQGRSRPPMPTRRSSSSATSATTPAGTPPPSRSSSRTRLRRRTVRTSSASEDPPSAAHPRCSYLASATAPLCRRRRRTTAAAARRRSAAARRPRSSPPWWWDQRGP